ncbi:MAG: glycosyltransferase family 4 protein [Candidatus Bathyarchaeota archaeon]|nr:glycosyltransferase family 4 protein [Candidatus Bathyarchaeota archaeon]
MSSILVILEKKPFGGAEKATHLIMKLLSNQGFNLTVIAGDSVVEKIGQITWVYNPLLDAPSKFHLWTNLLTRDLSEIVTLIKQNDVVYIPRLAYPLIPLAKRYGKKVVVHLHDYQPLSCCAAVFPNSETVDTGLLNDMKISLQYEFKSTHSLQRASMFSLCAPFNQLCKKWLEYADEIICVSERQRQIVKAALPQLANKLTTIYNPLPEQALFKKELSPNKPSILFMGGDSYAKGFDTFLSASQRILKRGVKVEFNLTRNVNQKNRLMLERLSQRFDGGYNIFGYLDHSYLLKLQSASHATLFPSIWEEPLPYAVAESMLSGTLPIASKVGGVPEIVEGTVAEKLLFNPLDIEECVERIETVLGMSNDDIIDTGYGLREATLARFSVDHISIKLLKAFKTTINCLD